MRISDWSSDLCSADLEVFSQRYERGATLVTSNLPFDEWTEVFGSERLTGALLDRLTHHVHILELNGESFRLTQSKTNNKTKAEREIGSRSCRKRASQKGQLTVVTEAVNKKKQKK